MTPQDYIQQELEKLKEFHPRNVAKDDLFNEIFRLLMSKKFRKYAANEDLISTIKDSIVLCIKENKPINVVFPHGAYKLWRLEEAPNPDWAELFASLYYSMWLLPICEIYKPGVWMEFFVDDLIVPKIDNIPEEDVRLYIKQLRTILEFLKKYQPGNMRMTVTPFEDLFTTKKDFEDKLSSAVEKFRATNPIFSSEQKKVVELNARPTEKQLKDPLWMDKILIVHDAYISMKREFGYYFQPGKIAIFNQPLASGKFLAVGTTKTSIAKFWVGVGVLKKESDSFREYILSPKQLAEAIYIREPVHIEGLEGKNFQTIRVIQ